MKDEFISDEQVRKVLDTLKWETLVKHKREFIISMVIKKLRTAQIKFSRPEEREWVKVVPVTTWPDNDVVGRTSIFVYEFYREWTGYIVSEKKAGGITLCTVKLSKENGASVITTQINKEDLCLKKSEEPSTKQSEKS